MTLHLRTFILCVISFGIFTAGSLASAKITSPDTDYFILCRRYSEMRYLRVEAQKDTPGVRCVTYYHKDGKEKKIGSSSNVETCKSYTTKVLDILKDVQWTCAPVEHARVFVISSLPPRGDQEKPERLSRYNETRQN